MAAKQAVNAQLHILRALNRWPKDALRPDVQFQEVMKKRFETPGSGSEEERLRQANALYSLLDNRYRKRYPINGESSLLKPKSNPAHYTELVKELDEAPSRTFLQKLLLRAKGVVRLQ